MSASKILSPTSLASNTSPELLVRRLLHSLGFRFRLHVKSLPGTPDILLPKYKKIILVNGCFWHAHPGPRGNRLPKSNRPYWRAKRSRNLARDRRTQRQLRSLGFSTLTLYECQLHNLPRLTRRLTHFLRTP
ncbi:MAG TPA: very short patch repair endonuclease [Verrucomicrobiae bacterium]|nr:very short patch repair endonuclease [Verrucomicrobiae bacterium]